MAATTASDSDTGSRPALPAALRVLHWIIILNFLANIVYGAIQVFVVLAPEGAVGPLFGAATDMPHDEIMLRRAYATEVWISVTGLSLYVAVTEFLPRLLRRPR